MKNTALIHCERLVVDRDEGGKPDDQLDLTAHAGSVISIIGPDYDSKANWLKTIVGVLRAESGRLFLAGKETTQFEKRDWVRIRTQFAYVHTETNILSAANALQNLMLPVMYHKTSEADAAKIKAQQLLTEIDAGNNLQLLPAHLKKEQRYKIAVARALMLEPQALLLDSPFTALDLSSINQFKQFLLGKVRDNNLLLILATHDIKFALQHSDQIIYVSEQQMLQFDKDHRIQDCKLPEVCDYLTL
ncbi:MAG: ATP-binding cassette domain-containing protein [Gammaproteobacteria bacterium]|nr:ATP-binding cassette domain-containing protein [Gammaproteobacteria bacterium]MDH5387437.1 ATP-binding cassette domain-containing protein [Gammaproteobacteria bacterium]